MRCIFINGCAEPRAVLLGQKNGSRPSRFKKNSYQAKFDGSIGVSGSSALEADTGGLWLAWFCLALRNYQHLVKGRITPSTRQAEKKRRAPLYFTGAPGVVWNPPNSLRPSGIVTVRALATLLPFFAR